MEQLGFNFEKAKQEAKKSSEVKSRKLVRTIYSLHSPPVTFAKVKGLPYAHLDKIVKARYNLPYDDIDLSHKKRIFQEMGALGTLVIFDSVGSIKQFTRNSEGRFPADYSFKKLISYLINVGRDGAGRVLGRGGRISQDFYADLEGRLNAIKDDYTKWLFLNAVDAPLRKSIQEGDPNGYHDGNYDGGSDQTGKDIYARVIMRHLDWIFPQEERVMVKRQSRKAQ